MFFRDDASAARISRSKISPYLTVISTMGTNSRKPARSIETPSGLMIRLVFPLAGKRYEPHALVGRARPPRKPVALRPLCPRGGDRTRRVPRPVGPGARQVDHRHLLRAQGKPRSGA